MASLYDLFGVRPDSTHDELHRAYREQVRRLHPDSNPQASDEVRRRGTEQLVALNDAWQILGDPKARRRYDIRRARAARALAVQAARRNGQTAAGGAGGAPPRGKTPTRRQATAGRSGRSAPGGKGAVGMPPAHAVSSGRGRWSTGASRQNGVAQPRSAAPTAVAHPHARPLRPDECTHCGGTPAVPVSLRGRYDGALDTLFGRTRVEEGPLCGPCGLATFRGMSDDVLLTAGTSFGTVGYLLYGWFLAATRTLGNARSWRRLRQLPPPRRDPMVNAPYAAPMAPGPTLWQRSGMGRLLLTMGALVGVIALAVAVVTWHTAA